MSFGAGVAVGFAMGKKMFESGGSKPEEDWTPPADWPDIPEPSDYEMYFLIDVSTVPQTFSFSISDSTGYVFNKGDLTIDWGDGIISSFFDGEDRNLYHNYNATGKYVIKVSATETSCFLQNIVSSILLMCKLGDEIIIAGGGSIHHAFQNKYRLQYVKLGGKGGLPSQAFMNDHALCKVDITIPPQIIPMSCFYRDYNMKKFDFSEVTAVEAGGVQMSGFEQIDMPKCETIDQRGFSSMLRLKKVNLPLCTSVGNYGLSQNYALEEVNLPLCTAVGNYGLSQNYVLEEVNLPLCTTVGEYGLYADWNLRSLTIAEGCTFGSNCFKECYNLIPHPDGSTN